MRNRARARRRWRVFYLIEEQTFIFCMNVTVNGYHFTRPVQTSSLENNIELR